MFDFLKKTLPPVEIRISGQSPLVRFEAFVDNGLVMRMECVREPAETLLIGDIYGSKEDARKNSNRGYGSKLMEAMLSYATENGIRNITGNLSEVDLDHKERLHHFYEKFGFTIFEYEVPNGSYYGRITKTIEG